MRKLVTQYKQFITGLTVGVAVTISGALLAFAGGEDFQHVPYVIREVKGDTLVKTPTFSILYRGVRGVNAAGSMTIAGKYGDITAPWAGGHVTGSGGSATGIDHIHLYDATEGVATVYVAGQLFRVMDNATRLKVANLVVSLDASRPDAAHPLVIVEKSKFARVANGTEEKTALAAVNPGDLEYGTAASPKP